MTLLTYNHKYVVQSGSSVQTSSTALADDTQASQTFSLSSTKTVLAIYSANSAHGNTGAIGGFRSAISIDGNDHSIMNQSLYAANYSGNNTCVWVGELSSGSHTIKGRLACNVESTTNTVSNRTLVIYVFDGDEFDYVENSTAQTMSGATLVDDAYGQTTLTPSAACKALVFYGTTNDHGTTERYTGKQILINIGGTDYTNSLMQQSSNSAGNYADSQATAHVLALPASQTTFKGRFACNSNHGITVSRRFLCVLFLSDDVTVDTDFSNNSLSSTTTAFADDTDISITRSYAGELLTLFSAYKYYGLSSAIYGTAYGTMIDSSDVVHSRGSAAYSSDAHGVLIPYALSVASGSHTIKGRYATNYAKTAAYITNRQMIALWFPPYLLDKTFSASNDVQLSKSFSGSADIELSKWFSSTSDLSLSKSFSSSGDVELSKTFSSSNDELLSKPFSSSQDIQLYKDFESTNDLIALYSLYYSSSNDIRLSKAFGSSSDLFLSTGFSSSSDALYSTNYSSSNGIDLYKSFESSNDLRVIQDFSSYNDIVALFTLICESYNNIMLSSSFSATSDVQVDKAFSSSNDIHIIRTFASANDIAVTTVTSSSSDITIEKAFSASSDIALYKVSSSENDIYLWTTQASSNTVYFSTVFSSTSDIEVERIFESSNRVLAGAVFASASDVLIQKTFTSINDISCYKAFASSNNVILYTQKESTNDIEVNKLFESENDIRIDLTFESVNDVVAYLRKTFSSTNDIFLITEYENSSDICVNKAFSSFSAILSTLFEPIKPFTITVQNDSRTIVISVLSRKAIQDLQLRTLDLTQEVRTVDVNQPNRSLTL